MFYASEYCTGSRIEQTIEHKTTESNNKQKIINKLKVGTSASFYMFCVFLLCCMLLAFYNKW